MVILRPLGLVPLCTQHRVNEQFRKDPCFVIHPETSKLAEQLVIDPSALDNENYSGIYDESGDYIPQYCDNPDDVPRGSMQANSTEPIEGASPAGTPSGQEGDKNNDSSAAKDPTGDPA